MSLSAFVTPRFCAGNSGKRHSCRFTRCGRDSCRFCGALFPCWTGRGAPRRDRNAEHTNLPRDSHAESLRGGEWEGRAPSRPLRPYRNHFRSGESRSFGDRGPLSSPPKKTPGTERNGDSCRCRRLSRRGSAREIWGGGTLVASRGAVATGRGPPDSGNEDVAPPVLCKRVSLPRLPQPVLARGNPPVGAPLPICVREKTSDTQHATCGGDIPTLFAA